TRRAMTAAPGRPSSFPGRGRRAWEPRGSRSLRGYGGARRYAIIAASRQREPHEGATVSANQNPAGSEPTIATLQIDGTSVELPVLKPTLGNECIDIAKLPKATGRFTYDSGFTATASCK